MVATEITTIEELDSMRDSMAGDYIIMNALDFDDDNSYTDPLNKPDYITGSGWEPVGTLISKFSGSLDGQGYSISNLYISRASTDYVGLFGYTDTGLNLDDIVLKSVDVTGQSNVGGLVGYASSTGNIDNCSVTGTIAGGSTGLKVGGLVGDNRTTINKCFVDADVSGLQYVGTFAGDGNAGSVISNCYAHGSATRASGLSTSTAGFIGRVYQSKVLKCYSTASVHYAGGTDPTNRGFTGLTDNRGDYEMADDYWDTETSGQSTSAGDATGKTTAQMKDIDTFTNYDIVAVADIYTRNTSYIWNIVDDETYPFLSWEEADEPPVTSGHILKTTSGIIDTTSGIIDTVS